MVGTGIAAVAVIAAIVIGMMTYGQSSFGLGISQRDLVRAVVTEYRQQTAPTGQSQH